MTTLYLHQHVHACRTDDWVIFLDLNGDRYLSLAANVVDLIEDRRALKLKRDVKPDWLDRVTAPDKPRQYLESAPMRRPSASRSLALFSALLWAERVSAGPCTIGRGLREMAARSGQATDERTGVDLAYFRKWRMFWPRDYVCLFDSLALGGFLARRAIAYQFVVGVRARPFMAHCWIERCNEILNDDAEFCASFTEILRQ